jgi:hypothetical protein
MREIRATSRQAREAQHPIPVRHRHMLPKQNYIRDSLPCCITEQVGSLQGAGIGTGRENSEQNTEEVKER